MSPARTPQCGCSSCRGAPERVPVPPQEPLESQGETSPPKSQPTPPQFYQPPTSPSWLPLAPSLAPSLAIHPIRTDGTPSPLPPAAAPGASHPSWRLRDEQPVPAWHLPWGRTDPETPELAALPGTSAGSGPRSTENPPKSLLVQCLAALEPARSGTCRSTESY